MVQPRFSLHRWNVSYMKMQSISMAKQWPDSFRPDPDTHEILDPVTALPAESTSTQNIPCPQFSSSSLSIDKRI
jgi:hypothetical protein